MAKPMDFGVFDFIMRYAGESSPLRSDRVMGSLMLVATLVATAFGLDFDADSEAKLVELFIETLDGFSGLAATGAGVVTWWGFMRSGVSRRKF